MQPASPGPEVGTLPVLGVEPSSNVAPVTVAGPVTGNTLPAELPKSPPPLEGEAYAEDST